VREGRRRGNEERESLSQFLDFLVVDIIREKVVHGIITVVASDHEIGAFLVERVCGGQIFDAVFDNPKAAWSDLRGVCAANR